MKLRRHVTPLGETRYYAGGYMIRRETRDWEVVRGAAGNPPKRGFGVYRSGVAPRPERLLFEAEYRRECVWFIEAMLEHGDATRAYAEVGARAEAYWGSRHRH